VGTTERQFDSLIYYGLGHTAGDEVPFPAEVTRQYSKTSEKEKLMLEYRLLLASMLLSLS
jgi:hypothetical protein